MIYLFGTFPTLYRNGYNMITIKTEHPIAYDSADHIYPEGSYYDNRVQLDFVSDVEEYFGRKISMLDVGCAGGALVCTMNERGHLAVGLDGSDCCINPDPTRLTEKTVTETNFIPRGYDNWHQFYNQYLFTCDIRKEYTIFQNDLPMQFDLITAWDVLEHLDPDTINLAMQMVTKHLTSGGLFLASIALFPASVGEINYHKSVFDENVWNSKLEPHFQKIEYPFLTWNRDEYKCPAIERGGYLLYAGTKKI